MFTKIDRDESEQDDTTQLEIFSLTDMDCVDNYPTPFVSVELPPVNKIFEHENGTVYAVIGYSNLESENPNHPPRVEYIGQNGNKWSKTLADFYSKMKPTDRDFWIQSDLLPRLQAPVIKGLHTLECWDQNGMTHARALR